MNLQDWSFWHSSLHKKEDINMRRKTFILALTFNFVTLVIICVIFTLCISLWNKKRQGVTTPSWEGMGCNGSSLCWVHLGWVIKHSFKALLETHMQKDTSITLLLSFPSTEMKILNVFLGTRWESSFINLYLWGST